MTCFRFCKTILKLNALLINPRKEIIHYYAVILRINVFLLDEYILVYCRSSWEKYIKHTYIFDNLLVVRIRTEIYYEHTYLSTEKHNVITL